jgi:hypothetical protein
MFLLLESEVAMNRILLFFVCMFRNFVMRKMPMFATSLLAFGIVSCALQFDDEVGDEQEVVEVAPQALVIGGYGILNGIVPHVYEWGSENPDGKYLCAHIALKMAAGFVKPSFTPTLREIHDMFYDDSTEYRTNYGVEV